MLYFLQNVMNNTISLAPPTPDQTFPQSRHVLIQKPTKTLRQIRPISSGEHKGRSWADYWTARSYNWVKLSSFCDFAVSS